MSSLTETAFYTRRGINVGIVAVVLFLIIKLGLGYLYELWLYLHPPPPPPPTVAFGVLPSINFPQSTPSASLVYSLDTTDGKFPRFPQVSKVYFISIPRENLQSLNHAQDEAEKLRFKNQPQIITPTIRQWTNPDNPLLTLRFNIATGNFATKYDWGNDSTIFNQKNLPEKDNAIMEAQNFFNNFGLLPKELQNGKKLVSYLRASVGHYVPAPSLSSADFARVDFMRDDLDNYPLVGDTPSRSPLFIIFSGTKDEQRRMVEIHFAIWNIDKETFATYPLRPVEEAWNDLNSGVGYIANLGSNNSNLVNIKRVYLAYFYSDNPTNFLQPLYVFEADKGFVAYVPALPNAWLKNAASPPQ